MSGCVLLRLTHQVQVSKLCEISKNVSGMDPWKVKKERGYNILLEWIQNIFS